MACCLPAGCRDGCACACVAVLHCLPAAPAHRTVGRQHLLRLTRLPKTRSFTHPSPPAVIAPLTTLGHWQREIETWTDMNCVLYAGGQDDRRVIEVRMSAAPVVGLSACRDPSCLCPHTRNVAVALALRRKTPGSTLSTFNAH